MEPTPEPGAPRGSRAGRVLLAVGVVVVLVALLIGGALLVVEEDPSQNRDAVPQTSRSRPPGPEGDPTDRVAVGPGAVESSIRQVVRTLDGRVYIAAPDDGGAIRNDFTSPTVLTMYRATTTGIPTEFRPADPANAPRTAPPATMSGGDARIDRSGTIHVVYFRTDEQATIHQTFSTATDTWGPPTVVTRFGELRGNPTYGVRAAALNAIALDRAGAPFVAIAGAAGVRVYRLAGGEWVEDTRLGEITSIHPASTFDRQGRLHLTWLEADREIRYAVRDAAGQWSAPEVVEAGNPAVLSNGGGDQSPSITVDAADQPMVLYLSGNVGSPDERVRMRVKTAAGWTPDDPDVFAHAPGSYAHGHDRWALLGHDDQIRPAFLARVGDAPAWGPVVPFPPTDVEYAYDGSMSARYDPLYEVDCSVIDVVFFDEDSDDRGEFRPDLYYGAIRLAGAASGTASCREIVP